MEAQVVESSGNLDMRTAYLRSASKWTRKVISAVRRLRRKVNELRSRCVDLRWVV